MQQGVIHWSRSREQPNYSDNIISLNDAFFLFEETILSSLFHWFCSEFFLQIVRKRDFDRFSFWSHLEMNEMKFNYVLFIQVSGNKPYVIFLSPNIKQTIKRGRVVITPKYFFASVPNQEFLASICLVSLYIYI